MLLYRHSREKLFPQEKFCFFDTISVQEFFEEAKSKLEKDDKHKDYYWLILKGAIKAGLIDPEVKYGDLWKEGGKKTRENTYLSTEKLATFAASSKYKEALTGILTKWGTEREEEAEKTSAALEILREDFPEVHEHEVQAGETITKIKNKHHPELTSDQVARFNNLYNPLFKEKPIRLDKSHKPWRYVIEPGQIIWIPTQEFWATHKKGGLVEFSGKISRKKAYAEAGVTEGQVEAAKRKTPQKAAQKFEAAISEDGTASAVEEASRPLEEYETGWEEAPDPTQVLDSVRTYAESYVEQLRGEEKALRYKELLREVFDSQTGIEKVWGIEFSNREGLIGLPLGDSFQKELREILEGYYGTEDEEGKKKKMSPRQLKEKMQLIAKDLTDYKLPKQSIGKESLRALYKSLIASAIATAIDCGFAAATTGNPVYGITALVKLGEINLGIQGGHFESMKESSLQFLSEFLAIGRRMQEIEKELEKTPDNEELSEEKQRLQDRMMLLLNYGEKTRLENFIQFLDHKKEAIDVPNPALDNLTTSYFRDPEKQKAYAEKLKTLNKLIKKRDKGKTVDEAEIAIIQEELTVLIDETIPELQTELEKYQMVDSVKDYYGEIIQWKARKKEDDSVEIPHFCYLDTTLIEEHLDNAAKDLVEERDLQSRAQVEFVADVVDHQAVTEDEKIAMRAMDTALEEYLQQIENMKPDESLAAINRELELKREKIEENLTSVSRGGSAGNNVRGGLRCLFTFGGTFFEKNREETLAIMKERVDRAYEKKQKKVAKKVRKFIEDKDHSKIKAILEVTEIDDEEHTFISYDPAENPVNSAFDALNEIYGPYAIRQLTRAYQYYRQGILDVREFPVNYRPLIETAVNAENPAESFFRMCDEELGLIELQADEETNSIFQEEDNWNRLGNFVLQSLKNQYWNEKGNRIAKENREQYFIAKEEMERFEDLKERHLELDEVLLDYQVLKSFVGKLLERDVLKEGEYQEILEIAYQIDTFRVLKTDLQDLNKKQLEKNLQLHPETSSHIDPILKNIEAAEILQGEYSRNLLAALDYGQPIEGLVAEYISAMSSINAEIKTRQDAMDELNRNPIEIRRIHDATAFEAANQATGETADVVKAINEIVQKLPEDVRGAFTENMFKSPEEAADMLFLLENVKLSSWEDFQSSLTALAPPIKLKEHKTKATTSRYAMFPPHAPEKETGGHSTKNLNLLMLLLPEREDTHEKVKTLKPPIMSTVRTVMAKQGIHLTNHEILEAIAQANYMNAKQVKETYGTTQNIGVLGEFGYYPGVDSQNAQFSPDGYETKFTREIYLPDNQILEVTYTALFRDVCYNVNILNGEPIAAKIKRSFEEVGRPIEIPPEKTYEEWTFNALKKGLVPFYVPVYHHHFGADEARVKKNPGEYEPPVPPPPPVPKIPDVPPPIEIPPIV